MTERGATIEVGDTGVYVDKRHKMTRAERLELLQQVLTYAATQLDVLGSRRRSALLKEDLCDDPTQSCSS